jgi:hypothetical protein
MIYESRDQTNAVLSFQQLYGKGLGLNLLTFIQLHTLSGFLKGGSVIFKTQLILISKRGWGDFTVDVGFQKGGGVSKFLKKRGQKIQPPAIIW